MSANLFETTFASKIEAALTLVRDQINNGSGACITCSFQAEDMVVLHMLYQSAPSVPVLFLDTGYHFEEVYRYRDEIAKAWKLNLVNLLPKQTVADQEAQFGRLYETAPDRCCAARKVEPLFSALERYQTWFTGLRREQSKSRADLQVVDTFALPSGKSLRKISPLAEWTTREVSAYAADNNLALLPLYDKGYSSIGCEPCTSLPSDSVDPRSGRWGGMKLECGIHIQISNDRDEVERR
jgi:phosphoadenosine phosphosulfate reductase